MVSAGIACWAIGISLNSARETRERARVEKRGTYFHRHVTEASVTAISLFTRSAIRLVSELVDDLDANDERTGYDIFSAIAHAATKFQSLFLTLKGELYFVMQVWDDPVLTREFEELLYRLEDDCLIRIDRLAARGIHREGADDLIRDRAASLLKALRRYDESKHQVIAG